MLTLFLQAEAASASSNSPQCGHLMSTYQSLALLPGALGS